MEKIKIQQLKDNNKIREDLLRRNSLYFDYTKEIPFSEFVKIRKDLLVSSLLESRIAGIFNLTYSWETKGVKENILEFAKSIIEKQSVNTLFRGAFDSVLFGFVPAFVKWENIAGQIVPSEIDFASADGWEFYDGINELPVIRYNDLYEKIVLSKENKYNIIPIIRNRSDIFPLGEGIIEKLFWHTQYKIGALEFWVKFSEKFGSPYIIGETPDNVEDKDIDRFEMFLKKIKGLFYGLTPKGFAVKILESHGKGASSAIYRDLLQYCREDITLAVLGHTGAAVSTAGKLGGDNTAMQVRDDIAISDARIIEEFINTLIKYAVEINFGNSKAPKFEFYAQKSGEDIATRDKILVESGLKLKPEYFSETHGIDMKYIDTNSNPEFSENKRGLWSQSSQPLRCAVAPLKPFSPKLANTNPDSLFETVFDFAQQIIDTSESYAEAEKRLTAEFGSIDGTPIASMLAESLIYSNFQGRQSV